MRPHLNVSALETECCALDDISYIYTVWSRKHTHSFNFNNSLLDANGHKMHIEKKHRSCVTLRRRRHRRYLCPAFHSISKHSGRPIMYFFHTTAAAVGHLVFAVGPSTVYAKLHIHSRNHSPPVPMGFVYRVWETRPPVRRWNGNIDRTRRPTPTPHSDSAISSASPFASWCGLCYISRQSNGIFFALRRQSGAADLLWHPVNLQPQNVTQFGFGHPVVEWTLWTETGQRQSNAGPEKRRHRDCTLWSFRTLYFTEKERESERDRTTCNGCVCVHTKGMSSLHIVGNDLHENPLLSAMAATPLFKYKSGQTLNRQLLGIRNAP